MAYAAHSRDGVAAGQSAANFSGLEGGFGSLGAARNWRVAGVLFLIAAEAILYGYSYPFFSLALEKHGLSNWLIGLNASLAGAGILIVGPFLPRLIHLFGLRRLVAGLFLLSLLSFAALLFTDALAAWFASRFIMGACFAALWTTTEIWLNGIVDDRQRGRIIGASATLYAGAQFIGPLALSGIGVTGTLPILAAMLPLAAGFVVALSIRSKAGEPGKASHDGKAPAGLGLAFALAAPLIIISFLAGVTETALQSLLPLYGLAHGMTDSQAAMLVAVFSIGEAILVASLGWATDRYGMRRALRFCTLLALAVIVMLPASMFQIGLLGPALFLAGGVISGLYTLGVIEIGQNHRGQRLAVVSTGFAMGYAAGAVVGSTPIGFAIDLFGPDALPVLITACFGLMAITVLLRSKPETPAREATPRWAFLAPAPAAPRATIEVQPPRAAPVEAWDRASAERISTPVREVDAPLVPELIEAVDPGQRQERDLELSFRARAAEIARLVAERTQRSVSASAPARASGVAAVADALIGAPTADGEETLDPPATSFDDEELRAIVQRIRRSLAIQLGAGDDVADADQRTLAPSAGMHAPA